jgi:Leucine-rich repeat (LRR) protein
VIEQIAFQLEKMGSLRPWLQVSKGTRQHSRYLGTFELFLNLPHEIQNLILQKAGYGSLGNLLSTSVNVNKALKRNPLINFDYFEQNKEYQRSKYQRFYQLVRNGSILTEPDFTESQLTNREISEGIRELMCSDQQLVAIPPLPNCKSLDCAYNQITSLPDLPNCVSLICWHNQLTTLPFLPKCEDLDCTNNQITCLPKFDQDEVEEIRINTFNNPLPGPLIFNGNVVYVEWLNRVIGKYC